MIIFIETFVRSFDLLGGIMTVTSDFTQKLYENFAENTKLRAVENAVTKNGLLSSLKSVVHMQQICLSFQLT